MLKDGLLIVWVLLHEGGKDIMGGDECFFDVFDEFGLIAVGWIISNDVLEVIDFAVDDSGSLLDEFKDHLVAPEVLEDLLLDDKCFVVGGVFVENFLEVEEFSVSVIEGFFSLFIVAILLDDLQPALAVGDETFELVHEGA